MFYLFSLELIEEVPFSSNILPSQNWTLLNYVGRNAGLTYRIRVICAENYYNETCTTLCKPRDDIFGHYTCDDSGNKICLSGYRGENCETPICKSGCSEHGTCKKPGTCSCLFGWQGPNCSECIPYPGILYLLKTPIIGDY